MSKIVNIYKLYIFFLMEYKTVFFLEYVHCMPKFTSKKKKNMLMYIILLLTTPYSVACGSEGTWYMFACVCVCVCVCVRERERGERERDRSFYQKGRRAVNVSSSTLLSIFISIICLQFNTTSRWSRH